MGLVQSLEPFARPMKLATPIGATLGKSVQCKSPAVVWMIATGSAAGAGAALWTGGVVDDGAVDAACATPSREVEIIRKNICNTVRMDAPIGYVGKPQLYDIRCRSFHRGSAAEYRHACRWRRLTSESPWHS